MRAPRRVPSRSLRTALAACLLAAVAGGQEPTGARTGETPEPRPRVGLVLSGGGARGAAHIGVLQVLEELRVPVDVVVGTSMGSIVGGLYAAGYSPEELARIVAEADWPTILSDAAPREDKWFRRRQDDRRFQLDLEIGWKDGGPALPSGLIQGHNVHAFLDELLLPVATVHDFDDLRLPFRCVATDLADGSEVVLADGNLSEALRASMSLPGVFAPVERDGRVLVDGGVVDNVPVDVARALGAEVVIAVDISSRLEDIDRVRSLFGVSNQVIGILMAGNRVRSMESLRGDDLGIVPELGDLGTLDFERAAEAIGLGRAAAEALRERLARLSVDEARWSAFLERQRARGARPATVRRLTLDNRSRLSDEVVLAFITLRAGAPLDARALRETRVRLNGLGTFERIDVEVRPAPGRPGEVDVVVRVVEKEWGPNYLRFGLFLESDLRGSGEAAIGVQHTLRPLNARGGEWRNVVEIGTRTRLRTELYQPLDPHLRWFVAPSVEFQQDILPLIVDQQKVAEVNVEGVELALAAGRNLGGWGELRVQYGYLIGSARPEVSVPGLLPSRIDVDTGTFTTRLTADTLDSVAFPRRGVAGTLEWEFADESFGGDARESVVRAAFGTPQSFGKWTVLPSLELGTTLEGELALGTFYLGGFQRLSGLGPRELSGNHYGLGVLQSYVQLSQRKSQLGMSTFAGASLELGGIWATRDDISGSDLIVAGSVFLGADTFIGPVYLALGLAEGGERAAYVFVGPSF